MKFKKLVLFVLLLALATTMIGFKNNFANNSVNAENVYKTNLSTEMNDILSQDTKQPEDYVQNGQAPDGSIVNDEMIAVTQNEAVMFLSENGADRAQYSIVDKIQVDGSTSDSKPLKYASTNVATS